MNSYFGGAVAGTAGCLIFGALARLKRGYKETGAAVLCAVGLILTFATRPFEALLWCGVAVGFVFFYLAPKRRWRPLKFATRLLIPFLLVFGAGASLLAWYNWRITGDPAEPPYRAYQRVYGTPQPYWWQGPLTIASFRYPEIRDNYLNQYNLYQQRESAEEMWKAERKRLANFWRFFVGPFFTPALVFLPWIFRDRRIRPWLWVCVPFILAKASYHAWYPAHSAPETILIVLVILTCWRHLRAAARHRETGVAMTRALVATACLTIVLANVGRAAEPLIARRFSHWPPIWESMYPARRLRDDVSAQLRRVPGKHLVFVKYEPGHCFCEEWVFNLAELSEQRIVFARLENVESDQALARAFPEFNLWLMEPDKAPHRPVRISTEAQLAEVYVNKPSQN